MTQHILHSLIGRYEKSGHGTKQELTRNFGGFLSFLKEDVSPGVSAATWRTYVSAVASYARTQGLNHEKTRSFLNEGRPKAKRQTKQQLAPNRSKARQVTGDQLLAADEWLQGNPLTDGHFALNWLRATVYTGLRPTEWQASKIVQVDTGKGMTQALLVQSAKTGKRKLVDGSAVLLSRTIPFSHLGEQEISLISSVLARIQQACQQRRGFDTLYSRVRTILWRLNLEPWRDNAGMVGLTTGRHQFKDALESAGLPPRAIQILMGHASISTQNFYGCQADPSDISAVAFPDIHEMLALSQLESAS